MLHKARTAVAIMTLSIVASILVACGTLGLVTPKTFNERLAAGYATVTTVRTVTTSLLDSHTITSRDAQNVQTQANNARDALDIASDIHKTAPKAGDDKLKAAEDVIHVLQKYVNSKKGTK